MVRNVIRWAYFGCCVHSVRNGSRGHEFVVDAVDDEHRAADWLESGVRFILVTQDIGTFRLDRQSDLKESWPKGS